MVFLIQGALLGFAGAVVGCGLGAGLAKLFESLVREPSGAPRFPVQLPASLFLLSTLLAISVGLIAAIIPARRAANLDPATAIRNG
jgi:lipoprotein-releasing system permease protein